jgi:AcrR family transcriptional regulator
VTADHLRSQPCTAGQAARNSIGREPGAPTRGAVADRARTRLAILDAARDLASRHGSEGFTLVAVARAARVSHTTVYNHFENRDHILRALADAWNRQVLDEAERAARAEGIADTAERIRLLLRAMCQAKCLMHRDSPHLFEAYLAALDADPLSRDLYLDRLAGIIAGLIAENCAHPGSAAGRAAAGAEAMGLARALIIATAKFRHAAFIRRFGFDELAGQLDMVFAHIVRPLLGPGRGAAARREDPRAPA